jgi:hypothetical protein
MIFLDHPGTNVKENVCRRISSVKIENSPPKIQTGDIENKRHGHVNELGTATGYGLDDRGDGFRVPVRSRIFFSPRRPYRLCGPPNLVSNGHRGVSPGVNRPEREANHSSVTSTEVMKMSIYTSTPPHVVMT